MVLAAGMGARLRPLSDLVAKPLLTVGDRCALAHVLDRLALGRVDRIVVNAHHRAGDVRAFVEGCGRAIAVSEEEGLLGTAGGVARAAALLGPGDVFVWNADVIADIDLDALSGFHAEGAAAATLVVQAAEKGRGPVGVGVRGSIVRLRTERFGEEISGGEFVGISVIGERLRQRLPERGCLVGDAFLPALRAGATLRAFPYSSTFYDIGTVDRYLAANLGWLAARGLDHWADGGAQVAPGVRLDRSILGRGSAALGLGPISCCVVLPGARVTAPLAESVVTLNGAVPSPARGGGASLR